MLTAARLREVLHYNPTTGKWVWTNPNPKAHCIKSGDEAGSVGDRGYCVIYVDGKPYKAHRLAFLYMVGKFPDDEVDHINCNPGDNRWINLREATRKQNNHNIRTPRHNKSGRKGVSWFASAQKWRADIRVNSKNKYLGLFSDKDEAAQAYLKAALSLHGEFARVA